MSRGARFTSSLLLVLSGCAGSNRCYETCYRSMVARTEPVKGSVTVIECQAPVEQVKAEHYPEHIIVGKSHFSASFAKPDDLKRFAARIGANVVLRECTRERAGFQRECECHPIEREKTPAQEASDPNAVEFAR